MQDCGCNLTLINLVIGQIGLGKVRFSPLATPTPQSPTDIVLISGSIEYIQRHSQKATHPTLLVCKDHIQGKVSKFGRGFRWFHLRHSSFGGPTVFKAFLGTNIATFQPKLTKLRRFIAHILDHASRPQVRRSNFEGAILASWLLHPLALTEEVFCSTGPRLLAPVGAPKRCLVTSWELCMAFHHGAVMMV
jgi:hypothetical protein